jgi:cation:H+ antiporter
VLVHVLLAAAGLVLLTFAADHLVLGASRLAQRLRVSPVVVGVVVIGLGTSAPEFLVSGLAAARGEPGIAIGNIVGSNILNLTLILGLAAVLAPVVVTSSVIRREVRLTGLAVALFGLLAWIGLSPATGVVLAVGMAVALWVLVRWARLGRSEPDLTGDVAGFAAAGAVVDMPVRSRTLPAWVEPVRAVLGLVGVLAGAQLLVGNASAIATNLGVPQVIIGFTLVALGTSLPELVTSVQAQRRGESDLVVGNLFGSNLFNSLAGGAVIGFASAGGPSARAEVVLVVAMILTTALAWALLRRGLVLNRIEGVVVMLAYLLILPMLLTA